MRSWFAVLLALLQWVGRFTTHGEDTNLRRAQAYQSGTKDAMRRTTQSPPIFHDDQSYTKVLSNSGETVEITPVTINFDYELADGEMVYTNEHTTFVPNVDFDYSILELTSTRNLNRDTGERVGLDEVYIHHFFIHPHMASGSEDISAYYEDPVWSFPDGYGIEVPAENFPKLAVFGHFISNKNLAPLNGSVGRARKECNECYYAPGKGNMCTPDQNGSFACCGVKQTPTSCETTTTDSTRTKYRLELNFLVSRNIESFKPITFWQLFGPLCDTYRGSACGAGGVKSLKGYGGGAAYFEVPELPNEEPYFKTEASIASPASGELFVSFAHLHTGAVNSTLYLNGEPVCTSIATHGTDPDPSTNVGNEQDHLVYISSCDHTIRFEVGDVWSWDSYYYGGLDDPRFSSPELAGARKRGLSIL